MAAVDLHLKICKIPDASFIDTKLPATYVAPATHLLGHPTIVGLDVVGVFVGDSVGLSVGVAVGLSIGVAVGLAVVGDKVRLAMGIAVGVFVGDSVGLSVGLRVGLSVEHAPSNLMLLMWINWLPPN